VSHDDAIDLALRGIDAQLRSIVAGEVDAYSAGWNVWKTAFALAPESPELMWPLWLIWGALTDLIEVKPEEKTEAVIVMRRAASEWLALDGDPRSRIAYLDRWVLETGNARRQD
jgi:hypothetical protein